MIGSGLDEPRQSEKFLFGRNSCIRNCICESASNIDPLEHFFKLSSYALGLGIYPHLRTFKTMTNSAKCWTLAQRRINPLEQTLKCIKRISRQSSRALGSLSQ